MKHYLPKNTEDGAALIITLLIVVLLTTISVSFFSTTRTEQTATRNYTAKTNAEQFATMATQQAMATLQKAFNGNATGTGVVVSQPGAIHKYFFSNGTCTNPGNATTNLFFSSNSTNANGTMDMNNLTANSSISGLITGNNSDKITVYSVNVKDNSGNKTIGRIAYYIDDEGTKVNLNSASSNRSTLNVGDSRPLSLFGADLSANLAQLDQVTGGTSVSNNNISTWAHFFRNEQAIGAGIFSSNQTNKLAFISTLPTSSGNSTLAKTPWGTDRIFINSLSTNATDGTGDASVTSIFTALNDSNLRNIYGGNFSQKYTDIGVKQIAANILQMRQLSSLATIMNTSTVNASFSYNGTLIGGKSLIGGNYLVDAIPTEYLGYAPYPVINEVSVVASLALETSSGLSRLRPHLNITVELFNPYSVPFNVGNATIVYKISGFQFDVTHRVISTNQTYGPYTYGPRGNPNDLDSSKDAWGSGWNYLLNNKPPTYIGVQNVANDNLRNAGKPNTQFTEGMCAWNPVSHYFPSIGNVIPPYSKIQYNLCGYGWGTYADLDLNSIFPFNRADIEITNINNVKAQIRYIKILANRSDASSVRDWVIGGEIGPFVTGNLSPSPTFPINGAIGFFSSPNPISSSTYQRMCPFIKTAANATTTLSNSTRGWTNSQSTNHSLIYSGAASGTSLVGSQSNQDLNNYLGSNPQADSAQTIPSDPSYNNKLVNGVYANATLSADMREPYLVKGNFTSPADLGLILTNQRWRRLRMQPQPSSESALGMIPDWAMLDVIAFGKNATSATYAFTPVNPNGKFHVAAAPTPPPRNSGLKALVQTLNTNSVNATLADPMSSTSFAVNKTRFMGNFTANATAAIVAGNIANMTWSLNSSWGNSTSNSTSYRRNALNFPSSCFLLPSEICEIAGVADIISQTNYNNTSSHFKWNEGRLSAIIPGLTTCSTFFTIYAYAESLDKQGNIESQHLTKTLVEVKENSGNYTVKFLYTQNIPML